MYNYSFKNELRKANDKELIKKIAKLISDKIPGITGGRKSTTKEDRAGVDLWLKHESGREIGVDLKIRSTDCRKFGNDDLALENISVKNGKTTKIGWTMDSKKLTEYVCWYWRDTKRIAIIPFQLLNAAAIKNMDSWAEKYAGATQTTDNRYKSSCVYVPLDVIWTAVANICEGGAL